MRYTLTLLGQGPSKEGCPFDAETWATASVLNDKKWRDKPYSKIFCFDNLETKPDEKAGVEYAHKHNIPVVSTHVWPDRTEEYPLEGVIRQFKTNYLLNDMSYMIAMALYKGYKSIFLWGVDQGPDYIYHVGKSYTTFWLGVASGMGVKWHLCPNSILWVYSARKSGVEDCLEKNGQKPFIALNGPRIKGTLTKLFKRGSSEKPTWSSMSGPEQGL